MFLVPHPHPHPHKSIHEGTFWGGRGGFPWQLIDTHVYVWYERGEAFEFSVFPMNTTQKSDQRLNVITITQQRISLC